MSLRPTLIAAALILPLFLLGCRDRPPADPPAQTTAHIHDVADETCFICDPSKRDAGRLWQP